MEGCGWPRSPPCLCPVGTVPSAQPRGPSPWPVRPPAAGGSTTLQPPGEPLSRAGRLAAAAVRFSPLPPRPDPGDEGGIGAIGAGVSPTGTVIFQSSGDQILAGWGGLKQSTLPTPSLPLMLTDWHHPSGAQCPGGGRSLASPAGRRMWRQAEVLGRMGPLVRASHTELVGKTLMRPTEVFQPGPALGPLRLRYPEPGQPVVVVGGVPAEVL